MITLYSALLNTLGHHDDVVNVLFPRHFPEVILGSRKRSLSGDVFSSEIVTGDVTGVDVVRARVIVYVTELHSRGVIWKRCMDRLAAVSWAEFPIWAVLY